MDESLIFIITTVGGFVLAIIFALLWYYNKYHKLPQTVDEWKTILDDAISVRDSVTKKLSEVLAFFDEEKAMSETSSETIKDTIPATTYQMTEESANRIYATCASEEEKQRIADTIYEYENPVATGEECCVYTIETTGAIFEVHYGTPELIKDKTKDYKYLSVTQLSDICELVGKDNEFLCMAEIMANERKLITSYELKYGDITVYIEDGSYRV